jgi:hypothetical protein
MHADSVEGTPSDPLIISVSLLSKIRDCFAPLAMTNPHLEAFSVIARSFFATKQSGFGHRYNYNGLLAILDTTVSVCRFPSPS